jgi:hypothetical protein
MSTSDVSRPRREQHSLRIATPAQRSRLVLEALTPSHELRARGRGAGHEEIHDVHAEPKAAGGQAG